ncbi:MAG TPA: carbon-nitrogen hydrolase family protein [Candidatus Acidoferrales bacterium]|nr:carbon-nitrogen hydrolase family protein [Candidatus Acidoferrales bacterium]
MDKQRLRIGLVQLRATPAKDANLGKILQHIDSLGSSCDLVVFPEYCMGYPNGKLSREFVQEIAEPLNGGFVKSVAEKSKTHGSTVVLPIFERDAETVFNTSVIVTDGRVIGKYRKIHLFDAFGFRESEFFGHGTEMVLFSVRGITLGVITCYELRFPELMRRQVLSGARAVIVPAGWVHGSLKEEQWQTLLMARAAENTSYVIGVGNAHEAFIGRSMVADPLGIKILDLAHGERVGYSEIDDAMVTQVRERIPVLRQALDVSGTPCRRL